MPRKIGLDVVKAKADYEQKLRNHFRNDVIRRSILDHLRTLERSKADLIGLVSSFDESAYAKKLIEIDSLILRQTERLIEIDKDFEEIDLMLIRLPDNIRRIFEGLYKHNKSFIAVAEAEHLSPTQVYRTVHLKILDIVAPDKIPWGYRRRKNEKKSA
jgi:hypothetical protein